MHDTHRSQRMGDENHPATRQEIAQFKNKLQDDKKLRVFVVAAFEVDTSDLKVNADMLKEATRRTVNDALAKAFGEFDTVKFVGTTLASGKPVEKS